MSIEDVFRRIADITKMTAEQIAEFGRLALASDGIRNRNIARAQARSRRNQSKQVKHGRQHA